MVIITSWAPNRHPTWHVLRAWMLSTTLALFISSRPCARLAGRNWQRVNISYHQEYWCRQRSGYLLPSSNATSCNLLRALSLLVLIRARRCLRILMFRPRYLPSTCSSHNYSVVYCFVHASRRCLFRSRKAHIDTINFALDGLQHRDPRHV